MGDFEHIVIIGAQRSGSTYLYHLLDAQPDITMSVPIRPEAKYFLKADVNYEDYLNTVFAGQALNTRYLGEKSVSYYELPEVAPRINRVLPDVKLFVVLRDPVERALSNYDFSVANGLENRTPHEVFITKLEKPRIQFSVSVDPFDYLGRSDYSRLLRPFKTLFKERLEVLLFEDLVSGRENARVAAFLGLDSPLIWKERGQVINPVDRTRVPNQVRERLYEYFEPMIQNLEEDIDRDLTVWKHNSFTP